MANSEIDICNLALLRLGADLIRAFDEDNKEARSCKASYSMAVKYLMSTYYWTFARATVEIAKLDQEHPVYKYVYKIPSDCLQPFYISVRRELDVWEVEGDTIITDIDTEWLWYVKYIDDVAKYPPHFDQAVAAFVCADIAKAIVSDNKLVAQKIEESFNIIARSYSEDANIGSYYRKMDERPENDTFVYPIPLAIQEYLNADAEPNV